MPHLLQVHRKDATYFAKPNTRSIRWQICDPFLRFWFRYIEGNQGLIDNGMSSVLEHEIAESYATFGGPMLERFFRQKLMRTGKYTSWFPVETGKRRTRRPERN